MTKAGFESMEIAIQGTILDDAEALIIPADLEDKFQKSPNAKAYFLGLSRSEKRNML
ncbi:bacteriocin resistance YdeI/OmpD-like protein [Algoriphagus antarcticus]|uniref:Bacteriocin resistance YdeI/OmpD-like protein n=1 Tax=Algoriphagus antarcticus TaxID=238540 RepID=A0A3E0DW10_9BACT|nr:bacteriocin resistance YdeI/OmpD-like protein [Algoriphagus antarcticus]